MLLGNALLIHPDVAFTPELFTLFFSSGVMSSSLQIEESIFSAIPYALVAIVQIFSAFIRPLSGK